MLVLNVAPESDVKNIGRGELPRDAGVELRVAVVSAGHHSKGVRWWVLECEDEIAALRAVRRRRAWPDVRLELVESEINDLHPV